MGQARHPPRRQARLASRRIARRAFANHMFHARYLARLRYGDRLALDLDDMQYHVTAHAQDADYDPVKAQQVVDEVLKRHEIYMNPQSSSLSTALTSVGFVFYPACRRRRLSSTLLAPTSN